jgi:hypothetical protein
MDETSLFYSDLLAETSRNFYINLISLNGRPYSLWKYGNGHFKTYVSSFSRDWTVKERKANPVFLQWAESMQS